MAKNEKTFNEQNMRKIIRILSGLSASQQQLAQQCINEYDPTRTYQKDNICFFNGSLYRAKTVTNGNEPSPESTYFEMLDGVEEEIDAQYIETLMSTVSAETWDYLKNILSDQISTTHAWNSSTSYAQDQATLQSAKDYTDQQVSKSLSKSYVVVNDLSLVQEDKYIYLVEQGDGSYLSYVLGKDGNPISFGDPNNVNLEGYAKTEDIAKEYAKSSDLDSKFATITTTDGLRTDLNNHINNTVVHLTQAERDKLVTTDVLGDYAKIVDLPTYITPSSGESNENIIILDLKEGVSNAAYNTTTLQTLIETYPRGEKTFYFKNGDYYFNPIDLTNISGAITIKLLGQNDNIEYETSGIREFVTVYTNQQDFIVDKRNTSPGYVVYVNNMSFRSYKGYNQIPSGICFGVLYDGKAEYNFHFYNVLIHGFDYGFYSPGFSCSESGGRNITLSSCHYGIYITKASHMFHIENLNLGYNRVGVRFGHGGTPCSIKNIHVANGYLGADKDNFSEFIAIHTKGNTVIDGLYQEAYESSAQPEKTIIFDFEGWAYGCGHMTIKNTPIAKPDGKGGKWLRMRGYLGAGPETGNNVLNLIDLRGSSLDHYPTGKVKLINCNQEKFKNKIDDLLDIIDVDSQPLIFGLDMGMQLVGESKAIFDNYNMEVNINTPFNATNWVPVKFESSDSLYKYSIINNASWNLPVFAGLSYVELNVKGIYERRKRAIFRGKVILEKINNPNINGLEFGILRYNTTGDKNEDFRKICDIDSNTNEGSSFYVDEEFNVDLTKYDKPYFVFALRAPVSEDITSINSGAIKPRLKLKISSVD